MTSRSWTNFSTYLRLANGELKETIESLDDGVDRRHFTKEQIIPLQRLAKRSSKAASRLIAYLGTADAPNAPRSKRGVANPNPRRTQKNPTTY
jgi:hypothetical protein